MEVVSLDESEEIASARKALELGADHLLGGTRPFLILPVIASSEIRYWPFPGRVAGHPSCLEGKAEEIIASAKTIAALDGVHGLDLLAYRFMGDARQLIEAVVREAGKPVLVAGSIDRPERIATVVCAGAAAFTIGTAALDGVFPASEATLAAQIRAIQDAIYKAASTAGQRHQPMPSAL